MFKLKNFNSSYLTQRITFEQHIVTEEGGIHHEHYQPIATTWGHIYFEPSHAIHGAAHQPDIYTFVVRKSHKLMKHKHTIGRLRWNNQVFYVHQFFEDHLWPQFLIGRFLDKKY